MPARGGALRVTRWLAVGLAFGVIGLGAFVRLSDAGLGCPDWPGCYGHWLGVPVTNAETAAAASAFPGKPVDPDRAWKEMIHRYAAGTLGLLILGLFAAAWRDRRWRTPPPLESVLVLVVLTQALLGMWTVTEQLKPMIVTAHLIGGMLTLSLLLAGALRRSNLAAQSTPRPSMLRRTASVAVAALLIQIALGGWVSSNYAALACQGFPACNGSLAPAGDWEAGFEFWRELGRDSAGGELPTAALVAIHWTHRLGALVAGTVIGLLAWLCWRSRLKLAAATLAGLLTAQIGLGIANVLLQLPLSLAVAHTLGAALLLATTLRIRLGR